MNTQRDVIYKLRDALVGEDYKNLVLNVNEEIDLIVDESTEIDSSFYRDITRIIPKMRLRRN